MMQFALICRDGPDAGDARLAARAEHLEGIRAMKARHEIIDGGAILNDSGDMIGSIVLCQFPDREALDAYLRDEAYVRQGVWQDVEVLPFRCVDWGMK